MKPPDIGVETEVPTTLAAGIVPGDVPADIAAAVDRSGGTLGATAVLQLGEALPATEGRLMVEFFAPTYWAGFQVTRTPGLRLLLAAAVVLLVGLTVSLRAYPRRIWVEVTSSGSGSELTVAGAARDHHEHFTDELQRLIQDLRSGAATRRAGDRRR